MIKSTVITFFKSHVFSLRIHTKVFLNIVMPYLGSASKLSSEGNREVGGGIYQARFTLGSCLMDKEPHCTPLFTFVYKTKQNKNSYLSF